MNNDTDRSALGFQEAVKKHFAFVEDLYTFKRISSAPYIVTYASEKAFLSIYHERISFELYFVVGLLPEDCNNAYKVDTKDIASMSGAPEERAFYQASSKDAVDRPVEKLADLVRVYAVDALNASREFFENAANVSKQNQENALRRMELVTAENKAQKAWDDNDYEKVVEMYTQIKEQLSPLQQKKLAYARRRYSGK